MGEVWWRSDLPDGVGAKLIQLLFQEVFQSLGNVHLSFNEVKGLHWVPESRGISPLHMSYFGEVCFPSLLQSLFESVSHVRLHGFRLATKAITL